MAGKNRSAANRPFGQDGQQKLKARGKEQGDYRRPNRSKMFRRQKLIN
jgi:hypothetical protein